jgi:NAD(P)-dependent dehydrogenase (short-subunit alcohol dehydrogenase family)
MPEQLKTVLITGGTDGLGKATALLLAENGYRVFATGRNAERREALNFEAVRRELPLEAIEMDVCDDDSVNRAITEIEHKAGPVDVLVNNAGIAYIAAMEEITVADLRKQFETNFFGVVRVTQRVLPQMRARRLGRIINMSSVAGIAAAPLFGPYSSSKFALESISDSWRLELILYGIPVVLIEPGFIPSGMGKAAGQLSAFYYSGAKRSPYATIYSYFLDRWKETSSGPQRYTPDDCARVILRAVRANPPKARYTVTRPAWLTSVSRRLLSDRALDRWVGKRFGITGPLPH